MMKQLSVALIQLSVGKSKVNNLARATEKIKEAVTKTKVDIVALPECFNSPYGVQYFKEYAESIPTGETSKMLSELSKLYNVYIIGGTIPEIDQENIYNTCTIWNPQGNLIGKYRKMHLFDIDIPGKITFKESEILKAGNNLFTFDVNNIKIGVGICYDIRFPEQAILYRKKGCEFLVYPAAFNTTTGPLHWELLQKARAVDNQLFVCTISPARGTKGYIAWGHSQITDPWGAVKSLKETEDILYDTLDFSKCEEVRNSIPVFVQRRKDIYETIEK